MVSMASSYFMYKKIEPIFSLAKKLEVVKMQLLIMNCFLYGIRCEISQLCAKLEWRRNQRFGKRPFGDSMDIIGWSWRLRRNNKKQQPNGTTAKSSTFVNRVGNRFLVLETWIGTKNCIHRMSVCNAIYVCERTRIWQTSKFTYQDTTTNSGFRSHSPKQ